MPTYLFDTSAFVKYFHDERGRDRVISLVGEPNSTALISRLTYVEWHSAFARRVRTGEIASEEFRLLRGRFYADLQDRRFDIIPLAGGYLDHAVRLLTSTGVTRNLRTLDALQLAAALDFHQRNSLDAFVCADAGFCDIAQLEGLPVINPEAA